MLTKKDEQLDETRAEEQITGEQEQNKTERKCAEYLAGWKRAQADYLNLQKTTEREKAEWIKFANQGLLTELLPIYDHLKLAMKHVPEEKKKESWVVGVENIKNQFGKFLADNGVEEIKTVGEDFNPEEHEAVAAENAKSEEHKGKIKEELRGGYKLHGKVLYPARVTVE